MRVMALFQLILKLIPPITIPEQVVELWLRYRGRNAPTDFERRVQRLAYYATSHGMTSSMARLYANQRNFFLSEKRVESYLRQCHKGFLIAQNEIVKLLPDIEKPLPELRKKFDVEVARYKRSRGCPPERTAIGKEYTDTLFKSMVLREIANAIAWQILGNDGTKARALIQGEHPRPANRGELSQMLKIVNASNIQDPNGFALITDITSCIQVGDIIARTSKGALEIQEVKSGTVNHEIKTLLEMSPSSDAAKNRIQELRSKYGDTFDKQLKRVLRQGERMRLVAEYFSDSIGTDISSNLQIITNVEPKVVDMYQGEVNELLQTVRDSGSDKYKLIDECLLLGAFNNQRTKRSRRVSKMDFQHVAWHTFVESWDKCAYKALSDEATIESHFQYVTLPVFELRDKVFEPTHQPIWGNQIEEDFILDILFGRISLFYYFSPQRFVSMCNRNGLKAEFVTGRKYNKTKDSSSKSGVQLLDIHGGFVRISDASGDTTLHLGYGTLFKMIYEFHRPTSVIKLLAEDLTSLPDRLPH